MPTSFTEKLAVDEGEWTRCSFPYNTSEVLEDSHYYPWRRLRDFVFLEELFPVNFTVIIKRWERKKKD